MSETWVIDASTETLSRLNDELRGYLRQRVDNTCDAESLLSRTWIAAGRVFEGRCTLRYFLYSIARRLVFDYRRRLHRRPWRQAGVVDEPDAVQDLVVDLESNLARSEVMGRVNAALDRIPQHYAEVVGLVLSGYGHLAIAQKLGINYNTVRSRYSRGKSLLLELLREDETLAELSRRTLP